MSIRQLQRAGITATSGTKITGFDAVMANLNKELLKITHQTNKGLLLAGIEVRRDMENTPPLIPVDYGNLRSSFFMITKRNADPRLRAYEYRTATFKNADRPNTLYELREGHRQTVEEAESILSGHAVGVCMGFTAFYAAPVHEMTEENTGKDIQWKRPGSGPKFFQAAFYRNFDKIITIVKTNAQIRP